MQLLEQGIAPALEPEEPIRTPSVENGSPRRGTVPTGLNLLPSDGEAYLVNDALRPAEADRYLDLLRDRIDWRQESARLMGRSIQIPRLSAWHPRCPDTLSHA